MDKSIMGTRFDILAFGHHRGILGFFDAKEPLSGQVSNTDPAYKNLNGFGTPVKDYEPKPLLCEPLIRDDAAVRAAYLVNTFVKRSSALLHSHPVNMKRLENGKLPANILLFRDGGDHPMPLQAFKDKFNWSLYMFGQIPAEKGLAQLIGEKFSFSHRGKNSEAEYLTQAAREFLNTDSDVVFIHLKGPDEPGHDSDPAGKVAAIEAIDKYFLPQVLERMDDKDYIIITCDHATPCDIGTHSDDKVPVVVAGPKIAPDPLRFFGESFAKSGGLQVHRAADLLPYIKMMQDR